MSVSRNATATAPAAFLWSSSPTFGPIASMRRIS